MPPINWLNETTHPILILENEHLNIRFQPIEQNYYTAGNLECNAEVTLHHFKGKFLYQAGNVFLSSDDLNKFSEDLRTLLSCSSRSIQLYSLGTQFLLELKLENRRITISLTLREDVVSRQGNETLQAHLTFEDTEFIHRWRNTIAEYKPKLEEWLLTNPPVFDGHPPPAS